MFSLTTYDQTDINSIFTYAKQLKGHTFMDVLEHELSEEEFEEVRKRFSNKNNKGGLGTFLEEHFFHYKPNSDSDPDFKEAGLELKATPYEFTKKGEYRAGERLVLTMIQYDNTAEKEFYESHLWKKCAKILLVYYFRNKSLPSNMLYSIDFVNVFTPPEKDLPIILNDYKIITDKIKSGKAHELSEADTMYLGACTKGSTAKDSFRDQYYPDETGECIKAKSRAYCYKNSYMTYVLNNYIINDNCESESIIKGDLHGETFEDYLASIISKYVGKTDKELCKIFGVPYTKNKAQWTSLAYRMLGVSSNSAEELLKANISVRTIRLEENGNLKESLSLKPMNFNEVANQEFEDSELYQYFEQSKFLFIVFQKEGDHCVLKGCQLWNMPAEDLNITAKGEWEQVKQTLNNGVKLEIVNGSVANNLLGMKDSKVLHVRPHAAKSYYVFEDGSIFGSGKFSDSEPLPDGRRMTKQSFWLNRSYVLSQLNDELKRSRG